MAFYYVRSKLALKRAWQWLRIAANRGHGGLQLARSEQDRQKIYAFRHKIKLHQLPPHCDNSEIDPVVESALPPFAEDAKPETLLFYQGTLENPQAMARCLIWDGSQLSAQTKKALDLENHHYVSQYRIALIDQVTLADKKTTELSQLLLISACLRSLSREHNCQLAIVSCRPGELHQFRQIGLHSYSNELLPQPDGDEILLALFLDRRYCWAIRSPLYLARFTKSSTNPKHWPTLFAKQNSLILQKNKIQQILNDFYAASIGNNIIPKKSVFKLVTRLGGYLLRIPHESRLIAKDVVDEDTFFLVSGYAFIQIPEDGRIPIHAGGFIEDFSHLMPFHRRQYDIHCDHALVFVFSAECLYLLRRHFPYVYQDLLISITRQNQLHVFKQNDRHAIETQQKRQNTKVIKPKRFDFAFKSKLNQFIPNQFKLR